MKSGDNVLVFRLVHVVAQLVGCEPEFGVEAEVAPGFGILRFAIGHLLDFARRSLIPMLHER